MAKGFVKKEQPVNFVSKKDAGLLTSWSYSQWSSYETCPARVKYDKIDRVAQVRKDDDALARGIAIHTNCEQALLTGDMGHLDLPVPGKPTKVGRWKDHFLDLYDNGAKPELKITLSREWKLTEWFASNAWLRAKLDAPVTDPNNSKHAEIIDFKSGKPYSDHVYQGDLYSTMGFELPEGYETIGVQMWYIDMEPTDAKAITNFQNRVWRREDQPSYIAGWEHRVESMMNDTIFPHRPGVHCRWCGHSGKKGGVCPKG